MGLGGPVRRCVATHIDDRKPGQFADERFRERHRAWLKRVWWVLPIGAAFVVAIVAVFGWLIAPGHMDFFWGLGLGAGLGLILCLADTPPAHIERWRTGAEGERSTAKQLRPLLKAGWALIHDVEDRFGNIDHVVVGPPGVFTIDSKNPGGICVVKNGVLTVTWREDPDDGYEQPGLAKRSRATAATLASELRAHGQRGFWVQPVVALWAPFAQASIESDGVA